MPKVIRERVNDLSQYLEILDSSEEQFVFTDLCEKVYHSGECGYISRSGVVDFFNSREDYHYNHVEKKGKREETPAMKLGTLVHAAVLEPHSIESRYSIIPDSLLSGPTRSISSGAAKDWRDSREANGKIVIKDKDLPAVQAVANAVKKFCPELAKASLLPSYATEMSVYWKCPVSGLKLKLRADIIISLKDTILITDLKSSAYFGQHELQRKFENERLVFQSCHYRMGMEIVFKKATEFTFLLVRTKGAPRCRLAKIDPDVERRARIEYIKTLRELRSAQVNDDWEDETSRTMAVITPRDFSFMVEEKDG